MSCPRIFLCCMCLMTEIYLIRQIINWSPKTPSGWKSLVLFALFLFCRLSWNMIIDIIYGHKFYKDILYNLYCTILVYYPFKEVDQRDYSELSKNGLKNGLITSSKYFIQNCNLFFIAYPFAKNGFLSIGQDEIDPSQNVTVTENIS